MSDAVPEIYMICNSEMPLLLHFSIIADFVFCPFWTTLTPMRQVLLFVVGRNTKLGLPAIYSDKIAVEKAKII